MRPSFGTVVFYLIFIAISSVAAAPGATPKAARPAPEIQRVLDLYKAAMEALSVERLDKVMDSELLVLEMGGKDVGWAEYRNHHIGEHMKEWKSLSVSALKVLESSVGGDWAYAAQESLNTIVTKEEKTQVLAVTETFILKKRRDGWKIKHLHISLRKKPS